jgi:hypothetical protein
MIPQARSASIAGAAARSPYLTPLEVAAGRRRRGEDHARSGGARGMGRAQGQGEGLGAAQGHRGGRWPCRGWGVTSVTGMPLDTLSFVYHIL